MHYYRADLSDVQILVDYRIEFLEEYWGSQPEEISNQLQKNLKKYFTDSLINNTYISWLAKAENKIVGVGGIVIREQAGNFKNPTGRVGYLINMYTIPDYRRKGISTNILNRLITSAQEIGINAFELHATKEGEPLYQKNGFKIHGEPTYRKYI